jgi:hypothetical protein
VPLEQRVLCELGGVLGGAGGAIAGDEYRTARSEALELARGLALAAHDWEVVTDDGLSVLELPVDDSLAELEPEDVSPLPEVLDSEDSAAVFEVVPVASVPEPDVEAVLALDATVELLRRAADAVRAGSWPVASWT